MSDLAIAAAASADASVVVANRPTDMVYNADRSLLYAARADGKVSVIDAFSGAVLETINVGTELTGIDISADGSFLIAVERQGTTIDANYTNFVVHRVDLATRTVTDYGKQFWGPFGPFQDVALLADNSALVSTTIRGSGSGEVYRLDLGTGVFTLVAQSGAFEAGPPQGATLVASADRLHAFVGGGFNVSGAAMVFELTPDETVRKIATRGVPTTNLAYSYDGSLIAHGDYGGLTVFDSTLHPLVTLSAVGSDVMALAFDDTHENLFAYRYGGFVNGASVFEIVQVSTSDWSIVQRIPLAGGPYTLANTRLVVGPDNQYFALIDGEELLRYDNPSAPAVTEGDSGDNVMNGGAGQDFLHGLDGNDTLHGGASNDTLRGGAGDDMLDGGTGRDLMFGGDGDDIYIVDDSSDRAAEASASGGSDEVRASVSFAIEGNIERLVLTGSGAIDGTGNDGANLITGNGAANVLEGMGGDDTLLGGGGNDTLHGGTGADSMTGGTGDDVYYVDNNGDVVIEAAGEGVDTVIASISYTLGAMLENLRAADGNAAINLTGNGEANRIDGNGGANTLRGGGGDDTLYGMGGNDSLIGEDGQDVLVGGLGNDAYLADAGDIIVEAVGEGRDTVYVTGSFSLAAGAAIEVLTVYDRATANTLTLNGNAFSNTLYGNMGANGLIGGGGGDLLYGLGGDDTYIVNDAADRVIEVAGQGRDTVYALGSFALLPDAEVEVLTAYDRAGTGALNLTGSTTNNLIYGNMGTNGLIGGGGSDVLYGLGGDDAYIVDDASDQVIEFAGQGLDTVYALGSFALLPDAEVEVLTTYDRAGTGAINLTGSATNNLIYGNMGTNGLIGGGGSDVLYGLGGDDAYIVDDASDQVIEFTGQGRDTVYATGSFALAAGSEVEVLTAYDRAASGTINLSGNALANTIYGNAGANVLDGKGGADVLYGFGGADTFQFTTALQPGAAPAVIGDFVSGQDRIALDDAVFGGVASDALSAIFVTGSAAVDADDRLIYDPTTGALWYDADGTGAAAAVHFATLQGHPTLTSGDFLIF